MKIGWQILLLSSPLSLSALGFAVLIFFEQPLAETRQYWCPLPFNSKQWKDSAGTALEVRQRMLIDLTTRNGLIGMTENQIIELLGPPVDYTDGSSTPLDYEIGWCGLDALHLLIFFQAHKAVSIKITQT